MTHLTSFDDVRSLDARGRSVDSDLAKPRLVLVAHGVHDSGGMERSFAELVHRLHDRYELVVISADLGDPLRTLVEWRRIRIPRRPAFLRFAVFWLAAAAHVRRERTALVQTLGAIVPNSVDVASVQHCNAGFRRAVGRLAPPDAPWSRRLNTAMTRGIGLAAERLSYRPRRVRKVVPVSAGVARELRKDYPGLIIDVIPNGVDSERFRQDGRVRREVRTELSISDEEIVAAFVGSDWHAKGLAIAIEGVAEARGSTELPIRLLVVGRGDEKYFGRLASDLNLADAVVFAGWRSDTERLYAAADIFVFPSMYEAFPLVALEAAAAGLPIVAPLINGIEELIADGEAGIAVERSPESVGAAIAMLAEDAELRRRLGARGRERVLAYTWERWADSHDAIYRSLLADREPQAGVLA